MLLGDFSCARWECGLGVGRWDVARRGPLWRFVRCKKRGGSSDGKVEVQLIEFLRFFWVCKNITCS